MAPRETQRHHTGEQSKKDEDDKKNMHWRVPAIVVGTFIAGVLFAVGHHLCYHHYDNQVVQSETKQKWINRIGTGFAFLVKMCFAIATGAAYVQQFWLTLRSREIRVERIDAMFTVLQDPTSFWDLKLWLGNPLLTILAVVTWIVPFAAIVTPGTLTIRSSLATDIVFSVPPQLDTNVTKFVILDETDGAYYGPNSQLVRYSIASTAQQAIMAISPPSINSSYDLEFFAPAISCNPMSLSDITAFNETLKSTFQQYDIFNGSAEQLALPASDERLLYLAWTPSAYDDFTFNASYPNFGLNSSYPMTTLDKLSDDGATIYVFMPEQTDGQVMLLGCTLQNATYDVHFEFLDGQQNITIRPLQYMNPVSATGSALSRRCSADDPNLERCQQTAMTAPSQVAMMDVLGKLVVGSVVEALRGGNPSPETAATYQTTLVQATALQPFIDQMETVSTARVSQVLEEMFQNVTISMFASSHLLKDSTTARRVPTTTTTTLNEYAYRPRDLYIAYGSALLCTLICVLLGCRALWKTGLSYSNNFSTIMRTTRRNEVNTLVHVSDSMGADPLAKHVAKATLRFDTTITDTGNLYGLTLAHASAQHEKEVEKTENTNAKILEPATAAVASALSNEEQERATSGGNQAGPLISPNATTDTPRPAIASEQNQPQSQEAAV
ncbi:hypothetical protein H2200_004459 [Cladophialophora chaetospira]|uniref:Transmembrane protein n=1 Tax=Cladophialophora chaetospira TaxID=386627 RepID=A0AA38XD59_9EURO|nr:hypothetical protein H2200_004459 [Cladophialophora chaetospira]